MAFFCKDCSYRGVTSGELGECPACGSYNLERRLVVNGEQKPPPQWRLQLLIALWVVLIAMIIGKLFF